MFFVSVQLFVARMLAVSRLLNYFLRGLVVVVPLALTIYVCVVIFTTIDSWLGSADPRRGLSCSRWC